MGPVLYCMYSWQSVGPVLYCMHSWPWWRRKKNKERIVLSSQWALSYTARAHDPCGEEKRQGQQRPPSSAQPNGPTHCPSMGPVLYCACSWPLWRRKKTRTTKTPLQRKTIMGQRIAHQWRAPQVDLSPKRRGQKNALSPLGWKSGRERQNYRQPKTLPCRGKQKSKETGQTEAKRGQKTEVRERNDKKRKQATKRPTKKNSDRVLDGPCRQKASWEQGSKAALWLDWQKRQNLKKKKNV